jgi:hypothetical protein
MKMRVIPTSLLATLLALSFAAPALADGRPADVVAQVAGGNNNVLPVVLGTLAFIALFSVALGVLYLLKRQVGGFPEHPEWVAPITIMRSRDLPGDDGEHGHNGHNGHGGHDAHSPAH